MMVRASPLYTLHSVITISPDHRDESTPVSLAISVHVHQEVVVTISPPVDQEVVVTISPPADQEVVVTISPPVDQEVVVTRAITAPSLP